jgi:O-antigen ligase
MLLFVSTGLLLFACVLTPFSDWLSLYRRQTLGVWLCLYALAVLTVAYQVVSISADNSFAMSWVLAVPVIWYLVYAANPQRRWLRIALVVSVCVFAVHSAIAYLVWGERAYQPFGDPNHYASLLYLVWIPLAHVTLQRSWQGATELRWLLPSHLLLFTLVLAIIATGSRVGMTIVAAALFGWLLLVLLRRLSVVPLLGLYASAATALLVWWLALPDSVPPVFDGEYFNTGVGIRASLNLATLEIMRAAPLLGHGVFTFPMLYPLFRLPGDQSSAGMFVHNDYLQLLAESGPWLVVILLVVLLLVSRRLWLALFSKQQSKNVNWFGLAMACGALLAHASVNYVFYFLPLGIAFAVVCVELFSISLTNSIPAGGADSDADPERGGGTAAALPGRTGVVAMLATAFIFWARAISPVWCVSPVRPDASTTTG